MVINFAPSEGSLYHGAFRQLLKIRTSQDNIIVFIEDIIAVRMSAGDVQSVSWKNLLTVPGPSVTVTVDDSLLPKKLRRYVVIFG